MFKKPFSGTSKTEELESLDIPVEFSTNELVCSSGRSNEDSVIAQKNEIIRSLCH